MNNFSYNVPTIVHFGENQITHLKELKKSGDSVLIVYGGGSIKKNGLYDNAVSILKQEKMTIYELSGVEPNPRIQLVRKGVELCKKNKIDMILAIGGGSTIDCSKLVAAGACYDGDAWELMENSELIKKAIPIYCVLTLAATGSEMDDSTVISDPTINRKLDISNENLKPKMSILDPKYTFSVSERQTAAGSVDIMSHVFESYFTNVEGTSIQSHLCEAVLKTVIQYAPIAINEPDNYDARANLMWCSSLALNGILSYGAEVKWCVHPIEHELSAFYDITHGVGLAIITPVWMEYILNNKASSSKAAAKIAQYGHEVWGINETDDMSAARKAVECTRNFFKQLGMPSGLSEIGINDENFVQMAKNCVGFCKGCYVPLSEKDIIEIYKGAR